MKKIVFFLATMIALGVQGQDSSGDYEPQHFLVLGTGWGWAQSDLADNSNSDDRGNEARSGYNGELLYGYYPHQNFGVDVRVGVGYFTAEFDTNFRGLEFEDFENIPGLEGISIMLDESNFQTFYFSLGPTARLPLEPFDIHLGVQGGMLSFTEPTLQGSGFVFGEVFGFPYTVPYETYNEPKQITAFTYGGNLALVFTIQDFLTVRAETSYYLANMNYEESVTVKITNPPIPLPQDTFESSIGRNLSAGMLQFRLGVGVRL